MHIITENENNGKCKTLPEILKTVNDKKGTSYKIASMYYQVGLMYRAKFRKFLNIMRNNKRNGATIEKSQYAEVATLRKKYLNFFSKCSRMKKCGNFLVYALHPVKKQLQLINAHFCQIRLCPACSWRKSHKIASNLFTILEQPQHQKKRWVFITLTIKNCKGTDLSSTIDTLLNGWRKLTSNKNTPFRKRFSGMFRALEITYNHRTKTAHPHLHILCECDDDYFSHDKNNYLNHAELVKIWRQALGVDYNPVCDIRAVQESAERSEVFEVSKYVVKSADITSAEVVDCLETALHRRRLISYHDSLKNTKKTLGLIDEEMMDVDDNTSKKMMENPLIEKIVLHWNIGARTYTVEKLNQKNNATNDDENVLDIIACIS